MIERWLNTRDIFEVDGLPQVFVKNDSSGKITLLMAKFVDDLLIVGKPEAIKDFHKDINHRFEVGRLQDNEDVISNRLHISRQGGASIEMSMKKYLSKIKPIELSRQRRREQDSRCTDQETKNFLGLTDSLNFLGPGVLPQA